MYVYVYTTGALVFKFLATSAAQLGARMYGKYKYKYSGGPCNSI